MSAIKQLVLEAFSDNLSEASEYERHKSRVQKIKKGSEVSFTHHKTGDIVKGTYRGLINDGGRSYAKVETGKQGSFHVPVYDIHESRLTDE